MLRKTEHLEPLGNGLEIIVSELFHFSTDTILLANFSQPAKNSRAVDLGTGCGTIPLLWTRNEPSTKAAAVEIQPEGCDMLSRTLEHNGLENISVINADLRNLKGVLPFGEADLVACNPPYKLAGSGVKNPDREKLIARHEEDCTIDDVCAAAAKLLRFGGRFCICQRPERLVDILEAMRKHGLEPKRLRLVQQRTGKAPKLFLAEGRRGGRAGGLVVEKTLLVEKDDGGFSDEMIEIYGAYKEAYL